MLNVIMLSVHIALEAIRKRHAALVLELQTFKVCQYLNVTPTLLPPDFHLTPTLLPPDSHLSPSTLLQLATTSTKYSNRWVSGTIQVGVR